MKTLTFTTFSFLLSICAFAQPTLNLGGLPGIGTTVQTSSVNATGITSGSAGANQTWDFTAFPDTGAIDSITFVSPASTPFVSNFPGATIAYKVSTDSLEAYGYLKESSSALELLGSAVNDNSSEIISIYTNPQSIYSFPATLNSTQTDTYRSLLDYSEFGATFVSNGTLSYIVDGYGTLITNSGTYPNTLRFKKRDISTDSTLSDFGDFVSESRNTTYEWVSVANGASIGIWSISTDTTQGSFGQPDSYSLNVSHTRGDFSTSAIKQTQNLNLSVFPNPANDKVLILLPADASVSLFDLSGRLVLTKSFTVNDGSMPIMDVSVLPPSTYVMKAEGKGFSANGKLVVVH
jgi:hypothetical protein